MPTSYVYCEATLQPDGVTVQLDEKASLPPGRVMVTVETLRPRSKETMLEVLERIHREQRERGQVPMTEEEMEAEMAAARAEDEEEEERWRVIWSQTRNPPPPVEKP